MVVVVAVGPRTEGVRSGTTTDPRTGPSRVASTTSPTSTLRSVVANRVKALIYKCWRISLYVTDDARLQSSM